MAQLPRERIMQDCTQQGKSQIHFTKSALVSLDYLIARHITLQMPPSPDVYCMFVQAGIQSRALWSLRYQLIMKSLVDIRIVILICFYLFLFYFLCVSGQPLITKAMQASLSSSLRNCD